MDYYRQNNKMLIAEITGGPSMEEEYLSIKDGKLEEIKLIKFKKQCLYCKEEGTCPDAYIIDPATNVYETRCSKCNIKFRIPVDDYNSI